MRAEAFTGLGRREEAKTAWTVVADRYDEIGDKKAANAARSRLARGEDGTEASTGEPGTAVAVSESPDAAEPATEEPAQQPVQVTNRDANGTGA
jgi:hypothetical protein